MLAAILFGAAWGLASTNNFVVPSFRGQPNSEIGFWERFTVAYGAPGNVADQAGSNSGAFVTQVLSLSAFTTGSGNIYDPSSPVAFTLTDATPFTLGTVVLQVRTLGSELDYDAVQLSYNDGAVTHTVDPLFRQELDRGISLGASVSSLWQWDLRGLSVSEFSVAFGTRDSSLSMDAITLDTWASRLSVTVSRDRSFALDPTPDSTATYLSTNDPAYVPDSDMGRPIELFGAGFRNGFTAASSP